MRYPFLERSEILHVMDIFDKAAEEVHEYINGIMATNGITDINERLVNIIFARYILEIVRTALFKWLTFFAMTVFAVYILLNKEFMPHVWLRVIISYCIMKLTSPVLWAIGENASERFTMVTVPRIFENNKTLWKADSNRKDDE